MEREEASNEYKWNLEDIYLSQNEWDKDYEYVKNNFTKLGEFKGLLGDANKLEEYFKLDEELSRKLMKLYIYAFLGHDVSLKDTRYEDNLAKIYNIMTNLSTLTSYIEPELASYPDSYLENLIKDKRFASLKVTLDTIKRSKKHVLSEKEEAALATVNSYEEGFSEIYDTLTDTDLTFASFTVDNKEYKMTNELYGSYLSNPNREIRKKAYDSLYDSYKKFAHTYAKIFYYNLKLVSSDLKLRKYDSYLDSVLEGSNIPKNVYYKLVKKIDENIEVIKDYFRLLKQESKIEDFSFYDTYVSISSLDKKYEFKEQFETIKKALGVLGEEYTNLLETAFTNRWMDVYPSDTKSGGGYQYGSYDTHPYVFLNNTDDYNSMSTMAHELGHAMHSYYSNTNQPYFSSNYAIYVAEVASTVNEILLNKYMVSHSENIDDKIFFIDQYIKQVKATVFRQTMFSEFEERVHALVEKEEPLNLETINKEYHKVLEKHFSGVVNLDDNLDYEWIRISHFYRPFYVYKYATSYTCANYIATCILENKNDMKNKYFELLKSGGKDYPDALLKAIGVDIESDEPYDILFNDLKNSINELKSLIEQKRNRK